MPAERGKGSGAVKMKRGFHAPLDSLTSLIRSAAMAAVVVVAAASSSSAAQQAPSRIS